MARFGRPEIFNIDQGSRFTSDDFTSVLRRVRVRISMAQLERERGLPPGRIDLLPITDTARGVADATAIMRAGSRARRLPSAPVTTASI